MSPDHPTPTEVKYLNLGYNRFLDLYDEIVTDEFWEKTPEYRLSSIKDICSVYTELINYKPLKYILDNSSRPNFELVGRDLAKFLRNILVHFPFFKTWEDIVVSKSLVTAVQPSGSIDRFLTEEHPKDVKYRFWDTKKKEMTYIEINLQTEYTSGKDVSLNEVVSEKDGIRFLTIFMHQILMTQVESIKNTD